MPFIPTGYPQVLRCPSGSSPVFLPHYYTYNSGSNIPNHLHFPTFSLTPPTSACSSHPTNLLCLVNSYSFFKTDNILLPPRIFHSFLQADKGASSMLSQYRVIITLMCQSLFHCSAWLDCKRPWRAENVVFNSPLLTVAQRLPWRRCLINIC